uniref:MS159, putative transposase n=1 Tax=Microscilla sp. PRE1 TaxID=155537 RepID=Q93P72_9BACT|nr:IS21 family transposase [Microscilla sp. PRE1]AAK62881.1 MS159, putative transposase [Microscilla sp. PRE1]
MSKTLDPMDLKQIIRLHLDGLSNRKIGETLGISRNTVKRYLQLFNGSEYELSDLLTFDQAVLREQFSVKTTIDNDRFNELMVYLEHAHQQRSHPGFTFQYHYQEYRVNSSHPYSYTQFMAHYRAKYAREKGSMKLDHKAGHEMFVDFTGKKLSVVDKQTGEIKGVEVFVATLPCSQYTYVEACNSQKRVDFLTCLANALEFFGGVPKAIVSDNLKSAVTKASKYEADINRSLKEFALHYSCAINPTRSYSPQDKALVENAVHLVYQRIFYPIRQMTFFSLGELNVEIKKYLITYNDLLFQRKQASRKELYQSLDRGYLKPLPDNRYQLKDYRSAKVQKMGYIYFSPDKTYYSVPYRYIGSQTQIHYTQDWVEVYYNYQRIASHHRNPVKGAYVTNKSHLSSTHKAYSEWSPEFFRKKASRHGDEVESFMKGLFTNTDYPEINYKRANGILQMANDYGSDRLNKACKRACELGEYKYNLVKNILANKQEGLELDFDQLNNQTTHIPKHANIRGAGYYQ